MFAKAKKIVVIILLVVASQASIPQPASTEKFDEQFEHAEHLIGQTCDSLKLLLAQMTNNEHLTEIHRAKLDLMRSKFQILDEIFSLSANYEALPFDTISNPGNLLEKAQNLIVQSRPDEGIPLILEFINKVEGHSDSTIYAKIYLAEAYRQKKEYQKGIAMIYEILGSQNVNVKNRAFALNRMAALMNEKKPFDGNRADSVDKYSRLCIEISEKHQLTEYLALSQNELGNNYLRLNMPDSALLLISEAASNFLSIQKFPHTINTYLNLSRIYVNLGELEKAKNILLKALELGTIEENRNLFKYAYYYLADISFRLGDYPSAYEYLKVSYSLMTRFFDDRIQRQINEMSARYDLQEKETKIKEEAQKIRAYRLQLRYLMVISLIAVSLLMVLVVFFRFKNRAYKKLVEQNLKAMKLEKQVEFCLRNLSENDIMLKLGAEDRNAELALRLEKFMAEEKPYLWCDISLEECCKKLNTNRTYLSKLINDKYQMGFYDLLFEYRVKTAIECLNNPQLSHLSVEGIGEMAGFKSNSNFYKRFRHSIGMTPHQFRVMAQKLEKHPLA